MRLGAVLALLALGLTACSTTKSASHAHPTATSNSHVVTQPVPVFTRGKGTPRPTANPHLTPLPFATNKPYVPKTATPFPASAYKATLYGKVSDSKTRRGLSGVKVIVAGGQRTTTTNASGKYRVVFPVKAPVSVQLKKAHYSCGLAMGILHAGQTQKKNWSCTKQTPGHPVPPPFPSVFGQKP
jgi:hypothetical protein